MLPLLLPLFALLGDARLGPLTLSERNAPGYFLLVVFAALGVVQHRVLVEPPPVGAAADGDGAAAEADDCRAQRRARSVPTARPRRLAPPRRQPASAPPGSQDSKRDASAGMQMGGFDKDGAPL